MYLNECLVLIKQKQKQKQNSDIELTAKVLKRLNTQKRLNRTILILTIQFFCPLLCFFVLLFYLLLLFCCCLSFFFNLKKTLSVESACLFFSSFVVHWGVHFPSSFSSRVLPHQQLLALSSWKYKTSILSCIVKLKSVLFNLFFFFLLCLFLTR